MRIIGVDVGGTFTDIILLDTATGREFVYKTPSTPMHQEKAVVDGIEQIMKMAHVHPEDIEMVIHGTTVATNAMIQRAGAQVCLITTKGFEDIIEIGRQNRLDIYDLSARRPTPLVDRKHRIGVNERIDSTGTVITPLQENEIISAVKKALEINPESIAISFLFSYLNPEHERAIATRVRNSLGRYVVASSEVLPEFREFERTSTTVLEAYLGPIVIGYLERLDNEVHRIAPNAMLNIMQSNGGTISCSKVNGKAIGLAISGLAGGVIGGWEVAKLNHVTKAITLDMGGTSCDVAALDGGIVVRPDNEIAGFPLRYPTVDVKTIGAGGGSIAWIDSGGVLHVGPQSAGAEPGPASYGNGGVEPTITDANLLVGRLNPENFAGGSIRLRRDLAEKAIDSLAGSLNISRNEVAKGILRISTENMVQAIREITIEKGNDPRGYVLIPFGGAGPTQAVDIAEVLGINHILIPRHPGITSAIGLTSANLRVDLMQSVQLTASAEAEEELERALENLSAKAREALIDQGASFHHILVTRSIDMRYKGQSHELPVNIPDSPLDLTKTSRELFEKEHRVRYGYTLQSEVEWVTARVTGIDSSERTSSSMPNIRIEDEPVSEREVLFTDGSWHLVEVYNRNALPIETSIKGPLIVEQLDTTTWVGRGWSLVRKMNDCLWLRRETN